MLNFVKMKKMKKSIVFLLALVALSCSKGKDQKTEFSEKALAETLLAADGNQVAFSTIIEKHKGKTVVIEVWASWCGDCVKAMPKTKELQANNPDVDFVFISMDKEVDKWKTGMEKHALQGDHYMANDQMEGVFATAIDLDWIPRYIILDKTGKIVLYRAIETDFDAINKTLAELK